MAMRAACLFLLFLPGKQLLGWGLPCGTYLMARTLLASSLLQVYTTQGRSLRQGVQALGQICIGLCRSVQSWPLRGT